MELVEYQVKNFRSIKDSGPIHVGSRTVLVGRNESGKSNLLKALHSLNPPGGIEAIDFTRDFPMDLRKDEFHETDNFLFTTWTLDASEAEELKAIYPPAQHVTRVEVNRDYKGTIRVGLGVKRATIDLEEVRGRVAKAGKSFAGQLTSKDDATAAKLSQAWGACQTVLLQELETVKDWAAAAAAAIEKLRAGMKAVSTEIPSGAAEHLAYVEATARSIPEDEKQRQAARDWVRQQIPRFVYMDEFPELDGHQDMEEFIQRRSQGSRAAAHLDFERLCKVAGLDPREIWKLNNQDADTRNRLTNRASAQLTKVMRELWKDRPIKVKFSVDGRFFDTRISDQEDFFDVDVNLNERSRGFRWFFSFYTTFAADTQGGDKDKAILLLDEPGLYLHATSQENLVAHLWENFRNQILYTTHSPFMVPTKHLEAIRTVNRDIETGTSVANDLSGDSKTLFPLQSALGYTLAQSLFIGPNNLVVEGVTDFWYLSIMSEHLKERGRTPLATELVLTPAGGAQRIPTMVALLASQQLNVLVLLDREPQAEATKREIVRLKLLGDNRIVHTDRAFDEHRPAGADIEDVLDPETFDALVRESYRTELEGKVLALNPAMPRVVKRYESAFKSLGLEFNKSRPAKLFLRQAMREPTKWITPVSEARFSALVAAINGAHRHGATQRVFEA